MVGYARAALKLPFFVLLSLLSYAVLRSIEVLKRGQGAKHRAVHFLYGLCMWLIGVRVSQKGYLVPGPALVVANHCSYIDVLMIASLGDIHFTPKSDVRGWPLIGPLVAKFNVLFVDRAPGRTKEMQQALFAHLTQGGRICVFPEATTGDGRHLLPFKSSLFSLAEQWPGEAPLPVQPLTVIYRRVDGRPMSDAVWPKVAWYGDIDIVRHLLTFFSLRRVEAEVVAHPPLMLEAGETRKELCRRAETVIAQAYPYGKNEG